MNTTMNEIRKSEQITAADKDRAIEIARLIARLSEQEQDKIYYMLKGSEIFNGRAVNAMPRAAGA